MVDVSPKRGGGFRLDIDSGFRELEFPHPDNPGLISTSKIVIR